MSRKVDKDFADRLLRAAQHAQIPYKQTALGDFLGVNKQTVDVWMKGSLPRADTIFELADKFGVNARWLATGEEPMLPQPFSTDLEPLETDLVARYRAADPRWQYAVTSLASIATDGIPDEDERYKRRVVDQLRSEPKLLVQERALAHKKNPIIKRRSAR